MAKRVVLVTGASRGIGAETARQLGRTGAHVLVNYREKRKRAESVVEEIRAAGGSAAAECADLADPAAVEALLARAGRLDGLVLNASGGMERGADPGYAMRLNRDAQLHLATSALPLMPRGARIVFVTSHQAHFSRGGRPLPDDYAPVAASKRAGEDALRSLISEFAARGVGFTVVSGDMIDGTIIVRLLERREPDAVATRRAGGPLPTIEEFGAAVAAALDAEHPDGHTVYIGGADYLSASRPD
ncbi:SDR family oxidoreductase [Nocardia sp. NPDC050697]|uniref:SDR family oxidoreductase n=1 Tax=Nocardia sp. NPDC050697 TaxID=3155158 RepID=UPI00340ACD42